MTSRATDIVYVRSKPHVRTGEHLTGSAYRMEWINGYAGPFRRRDVALVMQRIPGGVSLITEEQFFKTDTGKAELRRMIELAGGLDAVMGSEQPRGAEQKISEAVRKDIEFVLGEPDKRKTTQARLRILEGVGIDRAKYGNLNEAWQAFETQYASILPQ